jgi:hypothetical protein
MTMTHEEKGAICLQRFGPDPDPNPESAECDFWEGACEGVLQCEAEWRQRDQVFSWIDEKPVWVSAADWDTTQVLSDPKTPCTRHFRLSLIGGGQIKVTENFVPMSLLSWPDCMICYEPQLRVQAETGTGLNIHHGILSHGRAEMATYAVVFPRGTPQEIANRTASTLRLIDGDRDNFYALLSRGERCGCCGRPLKDEVSKLLGIGPNCAKSLHLPHDLTTANRILMRRRELLG